MHYFSLQLPCPGQHLPLALADNTSLLYSCRCFCSPTSDKCTSMVHETQQCAPGASSEQRKTGKRPNWREKRTECMKVQCTPLLIASFSKVSHIRVHCSNLTRTITPACNSHSATSVIDGLLYCTGTSSWMAYPQEPIP